MRQVNLIVNGSETSPFLGWPGGRGTVIVSGELNGATVTIQMAAPDAPNPQDGTPINIGEEAVFTEPGGCDFDLGYADMRALVEGGAPSGLYVILRGVTL